MSRYNFVASVFKELGQELGMGPLTLDETDRLSLVYDGVLVTFAYTSVPVELVWIYVDLGKVPPTGAVVPQRLLQLAFEYWAKSVMTIGMDDDGRDAVGFSSIPVSLLNLTVLQELLDHMLQATSVIREELARAEFGLPQISEATEGGEPTDQIDSMAAFGKLC